MKFVNFQSVSIQNFLSVGNEPVTVNFRTGLHIITGVNKDKQDRRNGVGKSTIADAIHFAIFGSTIRELKKENIINHLTGDGSVVQLEFDITDKDITTNYKIVRTLEPSKCKFYINNKDETRDSIVNTTDYICKILNVTQDIFQNCVVMTVNHTVPFMAKKKVEKRKFIEGIFNLEVFSCMLTQLRAEYNDVKKDIDVEQARFAEAENSLAQYKTDKEEYYLTKKVKIEKLRARKRGNDNKITELKEKTFNIDNKELDKLNKTLEKLEGNLESCESKINNISNKITEISTTGKYKKDTLKKIGTTKAVCPTCLKPVTDNDKEVIISEQNTLKGEIKKCASDIITNTTKLKTVQSLKTTIKTEISTTAEELNKQTLQISESKNHQASIDQFKEWNHQIKNDIQNLNEEKTQHDDIIKRQEERLNDIRLKITDIQHNISILDVVKFVVSEEGVKSYIVKKILQVFNSKLAYYLSKMDANCLCIFNEYFEEEIVDEKGKVCSYYNFSGAERKNIDLACLFAFMDIRRLQGSVAYNFSVYDELLDSSLDERGVDLVLNILRERVEAYQECIMIISHRKESVKIGSHYKNPGEVIYLEKENGITRRVDFKEENS